ncbi:hypothetical protein HPP92_003753 [Vanilla planifolia]|uniref:Reticulon domain-containing protein n=1 Tax=Vanilla planifolia TaxID=51239 RepID=A0A835S7S0_VANPL|nr:hypothetical protein HPP92_003753 [Vanilla planifolia]
MWRDVSKTALFFGFGTFLLISSSYAGEVSFSMISAISYVGLLYLAVIFLSRSFLRRAEEAVLQPEEGHEDGLIGEEEAIWILRRILPYLNEMAVILFVMAKCGSSLTVSSLAKIGKYWLERFRDGWESCTHKKAVAVAVFTVIWNLSSTIARIWSVFMLIVVIRLYQQCLMVEGDEEITTNEEVEQQQQQQQKDARSSTSHQDRRRSMGSTRMIRDEKMKKIPALHGCKRRGHPKSKTFGDEAMESVGGDERVPSNGIPTRRFTEQLDSRSNGAATGVCGDEIVGNDAVGCTRGNDTSVGFEDEAKIAGDGRSMEDRKP